LEGGPVFLVYAAFFWLYCLLRESLVEGDAIKGNGTETSYKEIGNRCHRGTDVKETGQWNSWSFSVPVLSLYPI